jgi:hypothetical protein
MNKQVTIITGGVVGGMLSNGITSLLPQSDSPIVNLAFAGVSIFGATKVEGNTTKHNLLQGSLMGSAVVQTLIAVKKLSEKHLAARLTSESKATAFIKGATGLGCPSEIGLQGAFMGADGQIYQYDSTGLSGTYMDEAGNLFESNDGLNGVLDEVYDIDENGLNGAEDDIYGEDETGLNGIEEDLYNEIY